MRQIHSCHSPPPKRTFIHVILCEILTLYLLASFFMNVILLPHQVLSDDSPKPAGHHPHGNSFTVFTTGNGFQFRFFTGGGGSAYRGDSVSTDAFFNNVLPNSHHKPYLINFYTDFCMQCGSVEQLWNNMRKVSLHRPNTQNCVKYMKCSVEFFSVLPTIS